VAVSRTRVKLAIGILLGLAAIGLALYLLLPFTIGDDFEQPAVCECELLREWVADLAILPTEGETTIRDTFISFKIEHLVETVPDYEALRDQLVKALMIRPFRVTTDSRPDSWSVAVSPRTTDETAGFSWGVLFQSQDRFLVTIRVGSDLSAWGIDTVDELDALSDEEFDRIMAERQAEAIEVLKPFSDALKGIESP
jgi:hypothetical protein